MWMFSNKEPQSLKRTDSALPAFPSYRGQIRHVKVGNTADSTAGSRRDYVPIEIAAFFALTVALMTGVSTAPGQVSVSIGVEPVCPYGYFDYAPYACIPRLLGPDISWGGVCHGTGHGSMDPKASPVTSITATILAKVRKAGAERRERRSAIPRERSSGRRGHVVPNAPRPAAEHSGGYQKGKPGGNTVKEGSAD